MLTDRDERALLTATENRIAEPLRVRAALAAVGRLLRRERESVSCHPTAARTNSPATSPAASPQRQRTAPLPR